MQQVDTEEIEIEVGRRKRRNNRQMYSGEANIVIQKVFKAMDELVGLRRYHPTDRQWRSSLDFLRRHCDELETTFTNRARIFQHEDEHDEETGSN